MSGLITFTVTDAPVEAGKYEGGSLYTAITGDRTIMLEAPTGRYAVSETDTAILTDVSFAKAGGWRADYWLFHTTF